MTFASERARALAGGRRAANRVRVRAQARRRQAAKMRVRADVRRVTPLERVPQPPQSLPPSSLPPPPTASQQRRLVALHELRWPPARARF